ncbi:uncharacterized protein TNCV_4184941 [Trichonephila clavipes]|nr:uncharacterized protein TNCV_4184941 [Trichonephila clavipes]
MQGPVCCQDLKTSTQNYIHRVWQETWDQQVLNKLHSIHPSTSWAALPVRRHDVRLSRLRIGHTRFTPRHLLLGENAPECPSLFGAAWPKLALAPLKLTIIIIITIDEDPFILPKGYLRSLTPSRYRNCRE